MDDDTLGRVAFWLIVLAVGMAFRLWVWPTVEVVEVTAEPDPPPIWVEPAPRTPWEPATDCIVVKPGQGTIFRYCPE